MEGKKRYRPAVFDIGIVGGGINGLCASWALAKRGHLVTVYERDAIMGATSSASSKLLHGGLRYLETGSLRLVRESLRERDAWIKRAPHLAWPIRIMLPVYDGASRSRWTIGTALFVYDRLAGVSTLPRARWRTRTEVLRYDPALLTHRLQGAYEFSDAQMDDLKLGLWVAAQARAHGVVIREKEEVHRVSLTGEITLAEKTVRHDKVINLAGPWAQHILMQSGIHATNALRLIRGSHIILSSPSTQHYLLQMPGTKRMFFVLPWQGRTLVGTTEEEHELEQPIRCSHAERDTLMHAFRHYFPNVCAEIIDEFSGVRPLIRQSRSVRSNSREYRIVQKHNLLTVFGGKWTTSMALAERLAQKIERQSRNSS